MNVKQILKLKGSSDVATIAPGARVAEAARILGERRYGALVVAEGEGGILGILSERDIVRGLGAEGARVLERTVSEIMTADVMTCTPNETVGSVMSRMTEGRFRHMPVVEGGRMTGLLSIGDVVKARIRQMEDENAAMQDLLSG
jgi:CBS domain-containing protein